MKRVSIIFCFLFPLIGFSQDCSDLQFQELFTEIDTMPSYPGGEAKMLSFFSSNSNFKFIKNRSKERFTSLNFVVTKEGKVCQPKILVAIPENFSEEVLRIIRLTQWNPGIRKGKKVNVLMNILVSAE